MNMKIGKIDTLKMILTKSIAKAMTEPNLANTVMKMNTVITIMITVTVKVKITMKTIVTN
jgi:hypothetical protein